MLQKFQKLQKQVDDLNSAFPHLSLQLGSWPLKNLEGVQSVLDVPELRVVKEYVADPDPRIRIARKCTSPDGIYSEYRGVWYRVLAEARAAADRYEHVLKVKPLVPTTVLPMTSPYDVLRFRPIAGMPLDYELDLGTASTSDLEELVKLDQRLVSEITARGHLLVELPDPFTLILVERIVDGLLKEVGSETYHPITRTFKILVGSYPATYPLAPFTPLGPL